MMYNDLLQEWIVRDFGSWEALQALMAQPKPPKFRVMAKYLDDDWEDLAYNRYTSPFAAYLSAIESMEMAIENAFDEDEDDDSDSWTYKVEVA